MSIPYILWILRFWGPAIFLVLWVCYQLFIKRRPIKSLINDALAAFFFVVVWAAISYCWLS